MASLSPQESRVLELIAQGEKPAEIAIRLGISVKTVSTYRFRIMEKLGLRSNVDLARWYDGEKNGKNTTN